MEKPVKKLTSAHDTVLFIDDSITSREWARRNLSGKDYDLILAESAEEALEIIEKTAVNCVISDIVMPNISGIELCKKLKTDPRLKFIPILLLTQKTGTEDAVEGLNAGADDFVSKDEDLELIRARIIVMLRIDRMRKEIVSMEREKTRARQKERKRKEAEKEIREKSELLQRENWIREGRNELNETMRGEKSISKLAKDIITCLGEKVDARIGALYIRQGIFLKLVGYYGGRKSKKVPDQYELGEGMVGQVAATGKPILLTDVPDDYIQVGSGLGQIRPKNILVLPCIFEGEVEAVIELASFESFSDVHREFLDSVLEGVGIATQMAQRRERMSELLERTQRQSEELQAQQEELEASNEELKEQSEELKIQQEELQVTNEELEEKTEFLERQKQEVEEANRELEKTRGEIEEKAEELALASKYKSEFLANMSHELRTPLNSLLILAGTLMDNPDGNLTDDQVESAQVIRDSGYDLLNLINEILDLSKIEAGRMELQIDEISVGDLADDIKVNFKPSADEKRLKLKTAIRKFAPRRIASDRQRIDQIIRNLISNAIKFTDKGSITVTFDREKKAGTDYLSITVKDTGIGIPVDKQKLIFEAFQQADGSTARKYGGTGLGLSITRELVRLLGGEIKLNSQEDKGTTFTVYLPLSFEAVQAERATMPVTVKTVEPQPKSKSTVSRKPSSKIADDRKDITDKDTTVLIVEDDLKFAKTLMRECHTKGFKCIISLSGEEGLELAEEYRPSAILLDIRLPGLDGWSVLEQLKDKVETRHIPVHIMSVEEDTVGALNRGAIGYLQKPMNKADLQEAFSRIEDVFRRKIKNLLIVEDDAVSRKNIVKLIDDDDVKTDKVASGKAALTKLKKKQYDCVILDLKLPDLDGFSMLAEAESDEKISLPPVVVYTGKELTREEEAELRKYSDSIIIKGVRSEERLLDEVSLFLHRAVDKLPERKRRMIVNLHDADSMFRGKKVLIVDDDMRNLFALSNTLSGKGINTIKAADGKKALEALTDNPDVDLVLMDIMMPVMDGFETMKQIRKQVEFKKLPIIALTAKAMKGDREKCIAAGASDYLAKPVDLVRLFSMMRVWLYR